MSERKKGNPVRLHRGDLFELSVTDGRLGYGLVVRPGPVLYVLLFKGLYNERPDVDYILRTQPALVSTTLDTAFRRGIWTVIAQNRPIPSDVPFPNWKVQIDGRTWTTDFDGHNPSPIQEGEAALLDYKFSPTPLALQDAFEAANGVGKWRESYDKLTPTYAARRVTRA